MRRVLFVTTTYPLREGDAIPRFVADLAQTLARDRHAQVRVVAPHHAGAAYRQIMHGVEIQRFQYALNPARQCLAYGGGIPDNMRNFPRARFQLPGFFAAMVAAVYRNLGWADLIHAHWVEPALFAMAANFFHRRPLVLSVHSLKPCASRLARFTLARADRVLFNSAYTMSQAAQKGYACRGQVIYQGYDDRLFNGAPPTGQFRRRLHLSSDAVLVAALGRMIEVKGLHVLAEAADAILARRPSAHIAIAGDGPRRPQIESIVARLAHRERVHLVGALSRSDVADFLADADLFVNPGVIDSTGRAEGLGITTIEAMAGGLPCVGSRAGGITETILDNETGLLVPPGDAPALAQAVGRLIDNADLRRRFGNRAREIACERFTWPALARQVSGVYDDLLTPRCS